jgi:hypothetical protein
LLSGSRGVSDLGNPLGIDPRLTEGCEGIGILADKLVCREPSLRVAQVPPNIGIAHYRAALLDIQGGENGETKRMLTSIAGKLTSRCQKLDRMQFTPEGKASSECSHDSGGWR